jgi:hypothetical protein
MAALQPKELLNLLLEGSRLAPSELDQFIREHPDENQDFEYKDGKLATHPKRRDGNQTIREYVSGFANSDGGVLIIGVSEDEPRTIVPCAADIGGQPLEQWASRCLQDMTGYFSPQPRFQVIDHPPEGPVLTIAVARAPSLVPCIEARTLKYFFRIGDSTLPIPEYLIADLVLGRRQRPIFDLYSPYFNEGLHEFKSETTGELIQARSAAFSCVVENLSLTAAEDVKIGVVLWSLVNGPRAEINRHLRAYLEISEPQGAQHPNLRLTHRSSPSNTEKIDLGPFQTQRVRIREPFYVPRQLSTEALGAVYVLSKGAPPTWFQLAFESQVGGFPPGSSAKDFQPNLVRKDLERPQVAWTQKPYIRYPTT